MSPELEAAAREATDTDKAAAWEKFTDACRRWLYLSKGYQLTDADHVALADAACEYAGKRVERHVAAEREACARLVEGMAAAADMAGGLASPKQHRLHEAAAVIRRRGAQPDVGGSHPPTTPPAQTGQQPVATFRSNEDLDRAAMCVGLRAERDRARTDLAQEKTEHDNVVRQLEAAEAKWRSEMRAADALRAERDQARKERDQYQAELEAIRQSATVAVEQRGRLLEERTELFEALRAIAAECQGRCCECHGPEWAVAALAKLGGGK